ncbi:MAG: HAD hydrolase family protein [Chitinophagales bacterium]|nr:HAD hydrolase family protein [Chitinophagales bacterium]
MNVLELFAPIKTFVFDVDGVLTNSQLLAMEDGSLLRSVNIKDGYALQLAVKKGYQMWIISGGTSDAIQKRFHNLGLQEVHIRVKDKKALLNELATKHNVDLSTALYMGDDIPDYAVMQECGLPTCPADACAEIKGISKYISPNNGGEGCVRDVIEKVMKLNGDWELPS